jgi:hypothetical protein
MRTASITAACLAGLLATTAPADARVVFLGTLVSTAASNCAENGPGAVFRSRYHLSNLGDNPNFTGLSVFDNYGTENYTRSGGRFPGAFVTVDAVSIGNTAGTYQTRLRLISSDPSGADLTPTTNAITITGQIESPSEDPGVGGQTCVVTFRASYVRRLEQ